MIGGRVRAIDDWPCFGLKSGDAGRVDKDERGTYFIQWDDGSSGWWDHCHVCTEPDTEGKP